MLTWVVNARSPLRRTRKSHSLRVLHRSPRILLPFDFQLSIEGPDRVGTFDRISLSPLLASRHSLALSQAEGPLATVYLPFLFMRLRTLQFSVACKSFVCHSYECNRGVARLFPFWFTLNGLCEGHSLTLLALSLEGSFSGSAVEGNSPLLAHHRPSASFFSSTYKLPLAQTLSFDIHASDGGCRGASPIKNLKCYLKFSFSGCALPTLFSLFAQRAFDKPSAIKRIRTLSENSRVVLVFLTKFSKQELEVFLNRFSKHELKLFPHSGSPSLPRVPRGAVSAKRQPEGILFFRLSAFNCQLWTVHLFSPSAPSRPRPWYDFLAASKPRLPFTPSVFREGRALPGRRSS